MSYYSSGSEVYSYYSGVVYGEFLQDALQNKNDRFSTTSSQDDYFKKQALAQEAMRQLESSGYVEPEIAKEVDVESLKRDLKKAENGETSALDALTSNAKPNNKTDSNLQNNINLQDKEQINPMLINKVSKKPEGAESLENKSVNLFNAPIYQEPIISVSPTAPQISQAQKMAFNPLEIQAKDEVESKESQNKSTDSTKYAESVNFIDEASGKEISVPLTKENAESLKNHFGSLEKASDFVKSYYYDVAYKMGYLEADSNSDGVISSDEAANIKDFVSLFDGSYGSIADIYPNASDDFKSALMEQIGFTSSIEEMINKSIKKDSNFDFNISLSESFLSTGEISLYSFNESGFSIVSLAQFNFALSLDDIFLQLSTKENSSVSDYKELKEKLDKKFLESLENSEKIALEKSEIIVKNIMESV